MTENSVTNKKAAKSFLWSTIEKVSVRLTSFAISIVLARILSPSEFGIIGMVTIFMLLSEVVINSGFVQALIQKQDRTDEDFSTVFYFNLLVGGILYLILFFGAKYISAFYETPILVDIIKVLALCFILNSFVVVHRSKLLIKLDFKSQALIGLSGTIISGIIGIYFALKGHGVWSLVYKSLVFSVINLILLNLIVRWIPTRKFSYDSFKQLFKFSSKLLISGVYGVIFQNIYMVFIGKYFEKQDLGYYTRARQFTDISSGLLANILTSVTFPLLCNLQNDPNEALKLFKKTITITFFLIVPSMTLLAVLSEPIVVLLLTEKWLPIVPLIQWLAFAKIFTPINAVNVSMLNSKGRSDLYLKVDLFMIPIVILTLLITIPISIKAMVIGIFVQSLLGYFVVAYYPGKIFKYGAIKQILDSSKSIIASFVMAIMVFFAIEFIETNILKVLIGIALGIGTFSLIMILLKAKEVDQIKALGTKYFVRKK